MNTVRTLGLLFGVCMLSACIDASRVNERPIGVFPNTQVTPPGAPELTNDTLLNELQQETIVNPNSVQPGGLNPDPTFSQTGTINNILSNNTIVPPTAPSNPATSAAGIAAPKPVTPVNESIPVAWPTSDPGIVISPYDKTKKIRIINKATKKPYPSGTKMRDPDSPEKIFLVP